MREAGLSGPFPFVPCSRDRGFYGGEERTGERGSAFNLVMRLPSVRRLAGVGILTLAVVSGTATAGDPRERTPILDDGREEKVWGWSLTGAVRPEAEGDVLYVPIHVVVRGKDVVPSYRSSRDRLYEVGPDGKSTLVALRLHSARKARPGGGPLVPPARGGPTPAPPVLPSSPARPSPDAPSGKPGYRHLRAPGTETERPLTDAEIHGLRGASLDGWSDEAERILSLIDRERACISLDSGAAQVIPRLPESLRYLACFGEQSADLSPLARLVRLRFLVLRGAAADPIDLQPLARLTDLRVLELPAGDLTHPEALSRLTELRALNLRWCRGVPNLRFARGMAALRRIDVSHTDLADLSAAADLPALEEIDAHLAPVKRLPAGRHSALRRILLDLTTVPPAEVARFREMNPQCLVSGGRREAMLAALAGLDRIRLRSGTTCCRVEEDEVTRMEITKPEEIASFLALLRLDECGGEDRCMCCGKPTIEFHAGNRLLGAIDIHHASSLRWYDGPWPGDVPLAEDARLPLFEFLARHGEPGPLEGVEAGRRRDEARARREERHAALLGAERLAALRADLAEASGYEAYPRVLAALEPDVEKRVSLALRLRGADDEDTGDAVSLAARYSLFADPRDVVIRVGRKALDEDFEAARGFGYWLLVHGAVEGLDRATLDAVLEKAATRLLVDPDPSVRGAAIWDLKDVAHPAALSLLRRVLGGRRLVVGPSGETLDGPPERTSLVVEAALALVEKDDRESEPRIRALAAAAEPRSRRRILEALAAGAARK